MHNLQISCFQSLRSGIAHKSCCHTSCQKIVVKDRDRFLFGNAMIFIPAFTTKWTSLSAARPTSAYPPFMTDTISELSKVSLWLMDLLLPTHVSCPTDGGVFYPTSVVYREEQWSGIIPIPPGGQSVHPHFNPPIFRLLSSGPLSRAPEVTGYSSTAAGDEEAGHLLS
jgi:hypothetical protein